MTVPVLLRPLHLFFTRPARHLAVRGSYRVIQKDYILDIVPARRPFNCYLVVPLPLLQQLTPLIRDEILSGLADSDGEDRVILQVLLDADKIKVVRKAVAAYDRQYFW